MHYLLIIYIRIIMTKWSREDIEYKMTNYQL